mmetsp:Transcript_52156/g.113571  ORF Transcript_52156/g.113571 Transcript_52156/m.113571 type:complete len:99 (-) Transcript_52156:35-331(-)
MRHRQPLPKHRTKERDLLTSPPSTSLSPITSLTSREREAKTSFRGDITRYSQNWISNTTLCSTRAECNKNRRPGARAVERSKFAGASASNNLTASTQT